MKHEIIISDFSDSAGSEFLIAQYSRCLMSLPVFYKDISVIRDNSILQSKVSHILSECPVMGNKNGKLSSLFIIDDHVFMTINSDAPIYNASNWIPHYSQFLSGFFLLCHRRSTLHMFNDCDVPVFPLALACLEPSMPTIELECDAHSKSVVTEKDISVFFHGRYNTRLARKSVAQRIIKHIPSAHIINSGDTKSLPGTEYVDLMCRSKITWCPRSVKSAPDHECNAATSRESEAMCLELLVMRPSIGIIETEERIPGVHFVEFKNDSSDVIEKIHYYLKHDDERKEIAHNGRLWWERNCSTMARAKQIFSDCLDAIGNKL